jgi:precorrin isomerase
MDIILKRNLKQTPIGLVVGSGLAGGNMIAASSANKILKNVYKFDLNGKQSKKE